MSYEPLFSRNSLQVWGRHVIGTAGQPAVKVITCGQTISGPLSIYQNDVILSKGWKRTIVKDSYMNKEKNKCIDGKAVITKSTYRNELKNQIYSVGKDVMAKCTYVPANRLLVMPSSEWMGFRSPWQPRKLRSGPARWLVPDTCCRPSEWFIAYSLTVAVTGSSPGSGCTQLGWFWYYDHCTGTEIWSSYEHVDNK